MKRFIIWLFVLIVLGLAGGGVYGLLQPPAQPLDDTSGTGNAARYDAYDYGLIEKDPLPELFDLTMPMSPPASGSYDARILYNYKDRNNYHFMSVTSGSVALGRVENGIELGVVRRRLDGPIPADCDMLLRQRPNRTALVIDGEVLVRKYGRTASGGKLAYGEVEGRRIFDLGKKRLLKVDRDITFTDDFSRLAEDDTASKWEPVSGKWKVGSMRNVSLSSNAFWYSGISTDGPAAVITGKPTWNNYSFKASCRARGAKPIGLYFCWRNPDNYFLFRWGARTEEGQYNKRELIKVHNGRRSVLASEPGGFISGQWYRLEVHINDDLMIASIDGQVVLTAEDRALACGKVGLHTESPLPARFDDVFVTRFDYMQATFERNMAGRWRSIKGDWSVTDNAGSQGRACKVTTTGNAHSVAGDWDWHDYCVETAISDWSGGDVGLMLYYLDERNYYQITWSHHGKVRLVRRCDGKEKLLVADSAPLRDSRHHYLRARNDEGLITAWLDGTRAIQYWDDTLKRGKIGLYARNAPGALFDTVRVAFKSKPEPVLSINKVQGNELTMQEWADAESDWRAREEVVSGREARIMWHRSDFFGDTEMLLNLDRFPKEGNELRLIISADDRRPGSGYALVMQRDGGLDIELRRRDKPIARATVDQAEIEKNRFGLRASLKRKANFLIASINGRPLVSHRDHLPLHGSFVAVVSSGRTVDVEQIEVYSDSVVTEFFNKAPTDWRTAGGTWKMTNRWECDPRWSFFSGVGDRVAAIWHKEEFGGDVTMEYAGGIKMNRARGSGYSYAADLNMTICADGRDLSSGYSFVFGGWDDRYTRIMKGTEVLASTSKVVIPRSSSIHRRWFYLKAEKKGNHLAFYVDNNLVLEAEDPEPLTGKRCAIWTWHNGIMVARVRIAASEHGGKESPDFRPPPFCQKPY